MPRAARSETGGWDADLSFKDEEAGTEPAEWQEPDVSLPVEEALSEAPAPPDAAPGMAAAPEAGAVDTEAPDPIKTTPWDELTDVERREFRRRRRAERAARSQNAEARGAEASSGSTETAQAAPENDSEKPCGGSDRHGGCPDVWDRAPGGGGARRPGRRG